MKILIIGFAKIKYMPYLNLYLDNIDTSKNEVHVLYWNRDLQQEALPRGKNIIWHEFKCYQEDDVSRFTKIGSFLKFRNFAKSVIKKEKFDFLITLTTVVSVLLSDILIKKYPQKYFFDYRDITYEGLSVYKRILWSIVKNSTKTFVSSDAFRGYFPQSQQKKIHTTYNLLEDSLSHREDKEAYGVSSDKIRIAFWGFIRHEEINKSIIKSLANDGRFQLHYYGREQETGKALKAYAAELKAENVFFHGEYKPEDRYEFIKNTDIIHNIYDDSNMMLAMGNKFYDGIIFRIPQICTKGSFMSEMAEQYGVGKAVDAKAQDFADSVYGYYTGLDFSGFRQNCDIALEQVIRANKDTVDQIREILN